MSELIFQKVASSFWAKNWQELHPSPPPPPLPRLKIDGGGGGGFASPGTLAHCPGTALILTTGIGGVRSLKWEGGQGWGEKWLAVLSGISLDHIQ